MVVAGAERFSEYGFVLYQGVADITATELRVIVFSRESMG
jgi:hypothetical protein